MAHCDKKCKECSSICKTESYILNTIKYYIVCEYSCRDKVYIDDVIANMSAIIYPFIENIKYGTNPNETIKPFVDAIKYYIEEKVDTANYSYERFVGLLMDEFVAFLDEDVKYDILRNITIIESVNNDHSIYIDQNNILFHNIKKIYGNSNYLDYYREQSTQLELEQEIVKGGNNNNNNDDIAPVSIIWEKEVGEESRISDNPLVKLYDELIYNRGGEDNVCNYEYVWQWKITNTEYSEIKKTLTSDYCKREIGKYWKDGKKSLFIVVAYIAERYKREWEGNQPQANDAGVGGGANVLVEIGLGKHMSGKIAREYFFEKPQKIYPSQHLRSLYAEGGLPIKRILKDRVLSTFAEKLYDDFDNAIEFLSEHCKNKALKYSCDYKWSVYEFINALKRPEQGLQDVFSIEDLNDEIFQDFQALLINGRKKTRENSDKFKISYRLWKFYDEFIVYRSIALKSSTPYDEPKDLISKERIRDQWDIKNPSYVFKLEIDGQQYKFIPWKHNSGDYYRSETGLTEFPVASYVKDMGGSLENIVIRYIPIDENGNDDIRGVKNIKVLENEKNTIKFSSKNGYEWNEGQSDDTNRAAILSRSNTVENYETKIELNRGWNWYEYSNYIAVDGAYIYAYSGIICLDAAIHSIAKKGSCKKVSYKKEGEKKDVYLLDSSKITPENIKRKDIKGDEKIGEITYRNNDGNWIKYEANNPPIGYTRLKISGSTIDTFILPTDSKITRDIYKGYVKVRNFNGYEVDSDEGIIEDTYSIKDEYDEYDDSNKLRDIITLRIFKQGQEAANEYLLLDIVRPFERKDKILNNGQHIVPYETPIPQKLESNYTIRTFDGKGVSYECECNSRKKYSSEIIKSGDRYILQDVNNSRNLQFIYIQVSSEGKCLFERPLEISENNGQYQISSNIEINEGVIIHSLQEFVPELIYCKPYWIGDRDFLMSKISAIDRFKMSIKHNLYFDVLMNETDLRPEFFIEYCRVCENNSSQINWKALWDVTKTSTWEINWLSIPKCRWRAAVKGNKEYESLVVTLFKRTTILIENSRLGEDEVFIKLIDKYWDLNVAFIVKRLSKRGIEGRVRSFLEGFLRSGDHNWDEWKPGTRRSREFKNKLEELLN